jgi:hypothetical protein
MFIHNVKIIDMILCGTKLFQHTDVFAGSPGGVDGNVKGEGFIEEEREFREDWFGMFLDGGFQVVVGVGSSELSAHVAGDEGTVLNDVLERSNNSISATNSVGWKLLFIHSVQRLVVVETEIASVNDVLSVNSFCHGVDERKFT